MSTTRRGRIRVRLEPIAGRARPAFERLRRHREVACTLAVFAAAGTIDLLLTRVFGVERGLAVTEVRSDIARLGYASILAAGAAQLLWVSSTRRFGAWARCGCTIAGLIGSALLVGAEPQASGAVPRWTWFFVGAALTLGARLAAQYLARRPIASPVIVMTDSGVVFDADEDTDSVAPSGSADSLELGGLAAAVLVVLGLLAGVVASNPGLAENGETVTVNVDLRVVPTSVPTVVDGKQEDAPPNLAACAAYLWGEGDASTASAAPTLAATAAGGMFDCPDGVAERHDNITVQFEEGHQRGLAYEHVRGRVAAIDRDFEDAIRVRSGGAFEPQQLLGDEWFEWFEHFQFGDIDLWVAYDRKREAPLIKAVFLRFVPEQGSPPPYALLTGTRLTWWYAEAGAGRLHVPDDLDHRPHGEDPDLVLMSFDGTTKEFRAANPDGTLFPTADQLKVALG